MYPAPPVTSTRINCSFRSLKNFHADSATHPPVVDKSLDYHFRPRSPINRYNNAGRRASRDDSRRGISRFREEELRIALRQMPHRKHSETKSAAVRLQYQFQR